MAFQEIKKDIFFCGTSHPDREFFDELVPLPYGTSYNSFLVKAGGKTVLIDTTYPPKIEEFMKNLEDNGVETIDYIICNHAEQDHSGALPELVKKYPQSVILTNPKCKELIQLMLHVADDKFQIVEDGEELKLGDKTLKFIYTPWVHWPDTMFTYFEEDNILCTCDFLGSHFAFKEDIFADETSDTLEICAKRYYAEIMMPFRTFCAKYVKMIREMNVDMILPSHGPIHKNPDYILKLYEKWTSDTCENTVLIPYISMYNSTKMMVDYMTEKLEAKGIRVVPFNVRKEDLGDLAVEIVQAATIIFGASMVLAGPHPAIISSAYITGALRPKTKFISFIGSFGWGGMLTKKLEEFLTAVRCEKLEPVIIKGQPTEDAYQKLDVLIETIYEKHKSLGLVK